MSWLGKGVWQAESVDGHFASLVNPRCSQTLISRKQRAQELLLTTELAIETIAVMSALSMGTVLEIQKELPR